MRTALDDRDGFTKRRRQEAYDLLTELAGHPTPQGFVMLRPKGMEAHLGPFVDPTALHAVLSELAKNASQAAGHINQLCAADALALFPAKIGFMEAQHDWMQHFFGGDSVTRRHIDALTRNGWPLPAGPNTLSKLVSFENPIPTAKHYWRPVFARKCWPLSISSWLRRSVFPPCGIV